MKLLPWIAVSSLLLAACATTQSPPPEPRIVTQVVREMVPVPCKAMQDLGPEPVYPDTDEALRAVSGSPSQKLFSRTKLLVQGRLLRIARLAEYGVAKARC